ncbi:TetR/AcrR family transcriptional regulator; helix-turn-helix transcriptional regulator [Streptomyces sp. J2-1]|nr:TetR/AcrR family transcriptional regulator; helix-turn-helix transcriptional regulator [Streptomyces corallincola]
MVAEDGAHRVTMEHLAERAGVGKGTVFRRFGSRAGLFRALLEDDERDFDARFRYGPPPLGPGGDPLTRLIAYGAERAAFLQDRHAVVRSCFDSRQTVPAEVSATTRDHLRLLLRQAGLAFADPESLALQLTGALEGPVFLRLAQPDSAAAPSSWDTAALAACWRTLIERLALA